jgi:chromosome segregation ATPase
MKLFNQIKRPLSWAMGGVKYACEGFGPIDIPDHLVETCKRRGLPLDVSPVPAETRAQRRVSEEIEAARSDDLKLLKDEAAATKASETAAKGELAKCQVQLSEANERCRKLVGELEQACADLESARADVKATETLLAEATASQEGRIADAERASRKQVADAQAETQAVKAELAKVKAAKGDGAQEKADLERQIANLKAQVESLKGDAKAAEDLMAAQAREKAAFEERALKAEALAGKKK